MVGVPEETEEDVIKTIESMDDLRGFRSLIVPLFFVPMGKLKSEDWLKETEMNELHKELLVKCLRHDLYWIDQLIHLGFAGRWYGKILSSLHKVFVQIVEFKTKSAGIQT